MYNNNNYAVLEQEMGTAGMRFRLIRVVTQDVMSCDKDGLHANASFRIIFQRILP